MIFVGALFGALVLAIGVLWFRDGWSKASITRSRGTGESCQRGEDCRSNECLPLERGGVCTEACVDDGDCPREMLCGSAHRCVDRAWR